MKTKINKIFALAIAFIIGLTVATPLCAKTKNDVVTEKQLREVITSDIKDIKKDKKNNSTVYLKLPATSAMIVNQLPTGEGSLFEKYGMEVYLNALVFLAGYQSLEGTKNLKPYLQSVFSNLIFSGREFVAQPPLEMCILDKDLSATIAPDVECFMEKFESIENTDERLNQLITFFSKFQVDERKISK